MAPFPRGGGFVRGRGRGGRGDWPAERGRGRVPYDDRGDRYPRSRSQEGRWGRERDERDRGDRYPETDARRDPRDDRDRGDRELFRAKMEARASAMQETAAQNKEVSPPPVAPSAPAFGSVPNRNTPVVDSSAAAGTASKIPPTAPKAFGERPTSAGQVGPSEAVVPPMGPFKAHDNNNPIPVGPRAQQQKQHRLSSNQWINPNLKKVPGSPNAMRSQSFAPQRAAPFQHANLQSEQSDQRRPRSSDAKSDSYTSGLENRMRSHHSAEPGEITSRSEDEMHLWRRSSDHDTKPFGTPIEPTEKTAPPPKIESMPKTVVDKGVKETKGVLKDAARRKRPTIGVVRFVVPAKVTPSAEPSESDDEDMADYFAMEIEKTEAELNKLHKPSLPLEVIGRFAALSHGSMVRILSDGEGLTEMLADALPVPEVQDDKVDEPPVNLPQDVKVGDEEILAKEKEAPVVEESKQLPIETAKEVPLVEEPVIEPPPKSEQMDVDEESLGLPLTIIDNQPTVEVPSTIVDPEPKKVEEVVAAVANMTDEQRPSEQLPDAPMEVVGVESKPPSTPSQVEDEDDDETESEDDTYMNVDSVRQFMSTPPLESLPNFGIQPWDKDREFLSTLASDPIIDDFVTEHLRKLHLDRTNLQEYDRKCYSKNYLGYLHFTRSNDPTAVRSRDKFSVSAPAVDIIGPALPEPRPEGRGSGRRFATERDLERVLQASMREDEERKERELRMQKEKYRSDKEAVIPDMFWDGEARAQIQYKDETGYMPQDRLVSAWQVLAPINNFTNEESQLFEKRYLELPKQWGKIAEAVPNRDFGTCIQFYYLMKKELNLKEKLKKQPKRRKKGGRGKQRSSALVSELGNREPEAEENQEPGGENGERRRPRRAAAPTWGFEQPQTDGENTPAGTPGRRGLSALGKGDQPEKVDGRKGRRKAAKDKDKDKEKEKDKDKEKEKDKEQEKEKEKDKEKEKEKDREMKTPKPGQTLVPASTPGAVKGRSRSNSRALNVEFQTTTPSDIHQIPLPFEQPAPPGVQPPPFSMQPQPVQPLERLKPVPATSITDVMAAPSLRPEPLPPPQASMTTFNLAQPPPPPAAVATPERKAPTQASSYWSVSESNDFPHLLRAFGSDWTAIAAHMGSKTAVMVSFYLTHLFYFF